MSDEADEFLDRVKPSLWAVKRTPNDGYPPVYVKLNFGELYHVNEPSWMTFECADEIVRTTARHYSAHYRTEIISQMQMNNEKVGTDKQPSMG